jgi:hypothetical protein
MWSLLSFQKYGTPLRLGYTEGVLSGEYNAGAGKPWGQFQASPKVTLHFSPTPWPFLSHSILPVGVKTEFLNVEVVAHYELMTKSKLSFSVPSAYVAASFGRGPETQTFQASGTPQIGYSYNDVASVNVEAVSEMLIKIPNFNSDWSAVKASLLSLRKTENIKEFIESSCPRLNLDFHIKDPKLNVGIGPFKATFKPRSIIDFGLQFQVDDETFRGEASLNVNTEPLRTMIPYKGIKVMQHLHNRQYKKIIFPCAFIYFAAKGNLNISTGSWSIGRKKLGSYFD